MGWSAAGVVGKSADEVLPAMKTVLSGSSESAVVSASPSRPEPPRYVEERSAEPSDLSIAAKASFKPLLTGWNEAAPATGKLDDEVLPAANAVFVGVSTEREYIRSSPLP